MQIYKIVIGERVFEVAAFSLNQAESKVLAKLHSLEFFGTPGNFWRLGFYL